MRKTDVMAYYDGNGAAVARAIGYTRSAVQQWPEIIPEAAAYRLQDATNGELKVDPTLYRNDLLKSA
jgi:transcriptional repressor of cell division inhibition gene dicB